MNKQKIIGIVVATVAIIVGIVLYILKNNDVIPSEKKMARILADVYYADAIFQARGNLYSSNNRNDRTTENTYHTVLQHYGLTKTEFDSAVAWYSAHPDKYAQVYEHVVSILSKREGDYKILLDKRDSIQKRIESLNDSIRVTYLKTKRHLHVPVEPRDSVKEKNLRFEYQLDSIQGGTLSAKMVYSFLRKNTAKAPAKFELIVHYNDTIVDTTSINLIYSHVNKTAELQYHLRDTMPAIRLNVNMLATSDFKKVLATISDAKVTYMPYQITDSIQFDEIQLPPLFAY